MTDSAHVPTVVFACRANASPRFPPSATWPERTIRENVDPLLGRDRGPVWGGSDLDIDQLQLLQ